MFRLRDQRKAKMQWVQDPNQNNVDNLNNVRREASINFRNKKKEYLKHKIVELETNSQVKLSETCIGTLINGFQKGYQPRTNIVKDEKGDCLQTPTVFWLGTISVSY